jgi:uncharacterized protein
MPAMIGLIQLLGIGFGLYLVSLILYTMWGLTHPKRQTYASAVYRNLPGDPSELDIPIPFEERVVQGAKGELHLWVLEGKNPSGPRIVMTHGWGSSRLGGLKRLGPIVEHASQIILWDLPGHGDSAGKVHLGATEHHDLAHILGDLEDGTPTILFGWSMGAGISLALAKICGDQYSLAGIICESPYVDAQTPASNVIRLRGVPYRLNLNPAIMLLGVFFGLGPSWRGFARDELAKSIKLPILIIHGDADPVCPIEDAQRIASAGANAKLVVIHEGGHNNLWTDEMYAQQMNDAIESFLLAPPCAPRGGVERSETEGCLEKRD